MCGRSRTNSQTRNDYLTEFRCKIQIETVDVESMGRVKFEHIVFPVVMIVVASLVAGSEATCTRQYSSPQPDCSTARLGDGRPSDTHIPCLTMSPEDNSPRQLEFPNDK